MNPDLEDLMLRVEERLEEFKHRPEPVKALRAICDRIEMATATSTPTVVSGLVVEAGLHLMQIQRLYGDRRRT